MGGRGASSGMSDKGKRYRTEYTTVLQSGNIKFVKRTEGNANAPLETMTKGRVYVTVNSKDKLAYISYYDKNNKRRKTIDLLHIHGGIKSGHAHIGYEHDELGTRNLTPKERAMIDRVRALWQNRSATVV